MKQVIYDYKTLATICGHLNQIQVIGIDQARHLAAAGDLLDHPLSVKTVEGPKEKGENSNGNPAKILQSD